MNPVLRRISENFSLGNMQHVAGHLADDIIWNVVGGRTIIGKRKVLELCDQVQSMGFIPFENKSTVMEKNLIVVTGNSVDHISFYCDVYRTDNQKIKEITSYFIRTQN